MRGIMGTNINELIAAKQEDPQDKEVFDFDSPEDVLIEIIEDGFNQHGYGGWKGHSIETCEIIGSANPDVTGAASYEKSYGGFLDYTIEGMIDFPGEGWWVVEGITGVYTKGDWGFTDDDMRFYHKSVRPATEEEISNA